jgi:hypothetical protein
MLLRHFLRRDRWMLLASHPILGDSGRFQERPPVLQIMVRPTCLPWAI